MTALDRPSKVTPLSRAMDTIRGLRAELDRLDRHGELAVVGIGMRLPGGISAPEQLWDALSSGTDLIAEIPLHRTEPFVDQWNELPRQGGFLDDVLGFDAEYFRISPTEAKAIDPQHRLLLEVCTEALADAAVTPATAGITGLFIGVSHQDYRDWEPLDAGAHWATGNGHCFAAGRVAYSLGLDGPAVAVDTACSSSLVAMHQAGLALHRGEADLVLAGGVNLILSPRSTRLLGPRMGALAPDGRCKPFDARANGFTRSEGAVVVALKRLEDAVAAGDRIYATIKGSAVNQDGQTSGFTAPSVSAQVAVVRAALAAARVTADQVGFIEGHGTGTSLGDPIEMAALAEVLRLADRETPLNVGSVKANLGHLEAAAGAAGLVSAILSVRHGAIAPLVHFQRLNPRIELDDTAVSFATQLTEWAVPLAERIAGVSSFGMSGTNAHLVIGAAPTPPAAPGTVSVAGFGISAANTRVLRELAQRYAQALSDLADADYPAFAYSVLTGRPRLAVSRWLGATSRIEAIAQLHRLAVAPDEFPEVSTWPSQDLPRRVISLPHYPWQRVRHAPDAVASRPAASADDLSDALRTLSWVEFVPAPTPVPQVLIGGSDGALIRRLTGLLDDRGTRYTIIDGDQFDWNAAEVAPDAPVLLVESPAPLAADRQATAAACRRAAAACLRASDATAGANHSGPVLAVTRGIRQVRPEDNAGADAMAVLHGFGAVLGLERTTWAGTLDLPADPAEPDLVALLDVVGTVDHDDVLAVRDGRILTGRLVETRDPRTPLVIRDDRAYLVTGGAGGVGRAIVADLAERGARRIVLLGRRAESDLDPAATDLMRQLRDRAVDVRYVEVDVCDSDAVATLLRSLDDEQVTLGGIVHAAGTSQSQPTLEVTEDDLVRALGVKLVAAWSLHLACGARPLDFFVLVSSLSALIGTAGFATYSGANSAMDSIATARARSGLPAAALQFGPWDGAGMVDDDARATLRRSGLVPITPRLGCAALVASTGTLDATLTVGKLDVERLDQIIGVRPARRLLAGRPTDPAVAATSQVAALRDTPPAGRSALVREMIRRELALVLGHSADTPLPLDRGFFDVGLDSVMAVDLTRTLCLLTGIALSIDDVFNYATIRTLSEYLCAGLAQPPATAAPEPAATSAPLSIPSARAEEPDEQPNTGPGDPIAIVGVAGRFPGADSFEDFWDLLSSGRDGVATVSADRWRQLCGEDAVAAAELVTSRELGMLADPDRFDAGFFGISAREAKSMDPQQRLLLESAWHALEHANIPATSLRNREVGVYVAASNWDYARILEQAGAAETDAYFGTGTALNVAAGRLAYVLGTVGPALTVDTACSSSLVAVHLATRALRARECELALVSGVNMILDPTTSVAVSRAHMLSPAGRCKTFSAQADGFVRAEAAATLVLKPLAAAVRDNDRILGVIRGTAVGADGPASGLTAPNGIAQEAVIANALRDGGLVPDDVSYLETHGTGTALGDPIEVKAAWSALAPGRKAGRPLLLGAVKSNVGHAESAAGMVGLAKVLLSFQHELIPANLHCDELNPHIPWDDFNVAVVSHPTPWRRGSRTRIAGVSAFGFSGTNAHVLIEEPPTAAHTAAVGHGDVPLVLSAPDQDGLDRLSHSWTQRLETAQDDELAALLRAAVVGRTHHAFRRTVSGTTVRALLDGLSEPTSPGAVAPGREPRVAFLFTGQGSQYVGMGRELYAAHETFRERLDACDRVLAPLLGRSIQEILWSSTEAELAQTHLTQPALVCVELATAALWESFGVRPFVSIGHSVGEIAAAIHAGMLDLTTGLTLVYHRSRLIQSLDPGAMLAIVAGETEVREWIRGTELDIAAVNGDHAVVVSGTAAQITAFEETVKERGARAQRLVVSHAFHSRMMDPALPLLRAAIGVITPGEPRHTLVSNLTGELVRAGEMTTDYWCSHVRNPVLFGKGAEQLTALAVDLAIEVGPGRSLLGLSRGHGIRPPAGGVPSLSRGKSETGVLAAAAAAAYQAGSDVDWRAILGGAGLTADAPRYPFSPTRFWADLDNTVRVRTASEPHTGHELRSPALRGRVFEFSRSSHQPAYLNDHQLYGTVVVPVASHLATMLSALDAGREPVAIRNLVCPRALVLRDDEKYTVQLVTEDQGLRVASLVDNGEYRWQEHVSATRTTPLPVEAVSVESPDSFTATAEHHISGAAFYAYFSDLGYHLGPSFRWIGDLWIRGEEALVRFVRPDLPDDVADYVVYPGLIDSCFQGIAGFMVESEANEAASLAIPFSAGTFTAWTGAGEHRQLWGRIRVLASSPLPNALRRVEAADIDLVTDSGVAVLSVRDFRVRYASRSVLTTSLRANPAIDYQVEWREVAHAVDSRALRFAILDTDLSRTPARALQEELTGRGYQCVTDERAADLIVDLRWSAANTAATVERDIAETARDLQQASARTPRAFVRPGGPDAARGRAALWGMLSAVEAEERERRIVRIELEDTAAISNLAEALLQTGCGSPETLLRVGTTQLRGARLVPLEAPSAPPMLTGGVLITGGLGALGLSTARWAAARGARTITLMGRHASGDTAAEVIAELRGQDVEVHVVTGDVTQLEDCVRAVAVATESDALVMALHLAGANTDRAFSRVTADTFRETFAAKAVGADSLVAALSTMVDCPVVLYSSVSSVLGSAGQSAYAAANGYLNGLALQCAESGYPATAVAWGPWHPSTGGGLAATTDAVNAARKAGVHPLDDDSAWSTLDRVANQPAGTIVAVDLEFGSVARGGDNPSRLAITADLARATTTTAPVTPAGWLADEVRDAREQDRRAVLVAGIVSLVGQVLGTPVDVAEQRGFGDLGLDSIMAIDLRISLEKALAAELSPTIAFDHPTVGALTDAAAQLLRQDDAESNDTASARAEFADLELADLLNMARRDISNGI
ncbi:SDR family NAD(P)-dependent oxidoreductase [Nocardia tengchongensis]|uniref:SDR family NAD(P)-dependent oxidoreductase n=1 Tax=Nocardia tengchongensis TaxID=2055889 RepID=UPI0036780C34